MINTVLFDLDGTLLPINQNEFIENYFLKLALKCKSLGFDPDTSVKAVWAGTSEMIKNDGAMTNEQRFWNTFSKIFGEKVRLLEPEFIKFYQNEFDGIKEVAHPTPLAKECIRILKGKGYDIVLATNPVFPRISTLTRIKWAGLDATDFLLITTYENFCYSKPNPKYYQAIMKTIGKKPLECLMVGNDVKEDMSASLTGMDTFLLTECLINIEDDDLSKYKHGNFLDLLDFIRGLPFL